MSKFALRLGIQVCLGIIFFALGTRFSALSGPDCIHQLDPNHADAPELRRGFHGLKQKRTFLVIIILSALKNRQRRQAIRQTWLNVAKGDVREEFLHFFVVGGQDLLDDTQAELNDENLVHKDILMLPSVHDSYPTLTQKVLSGLVAMDRNVDFKYLLKCDDDTFVRLPEVIDELKHSNYDTSLYWGFFDGRAPVQRHSGNKWAEPDYVLCDRYLPYALGGGYILSANLVSFIADNADGLKLYANEDTSVGTWLSPLKVNRVHDVRFDTEFRSRGCSNKHLVSHKQSIQDMQAKHDSLSTAGVLCREETQLRASYRYNWSVPPSKCCNRDDSTLP